MLSGDLLPAHPQPQNDELFSSWLVRIAKANGQKLHTFCKMVFGDVSIWNRDIDKSVTKTTLEKIAAKTGTNLHRANQTALASFEGRLYEHHQSNGFTPWILPVGVYHRVRRRYGLQFCPRCLATDVDPYFRRSWRIALFTACPQHRCKLLECCPVCQVPIMFHRRDFLDKENPDKNPLTSCHFCGFDLTKSPVTSSEKSVVQFLATATDTLSQGWIDLPPFGAVYSFQYFAGVRHLMKLISIDRICSARFQSIGLSSGPHGKGAGQGIEYLGLVERHEALRSVLTLLTNWPHHFIRLSKNANLHMAYLMRDFERAPWWFAAPVRWHLFRASYQPNEAEIKNAVSWMQRSGVRVSAERVSRMLGTSDSKTVKRTLSALAILGQNE